jgi:hypothetical protein
VVLVELRGPGAAAVRELRVPRERELPRIPRRGTATVEEALAALRALPDRREAPANCQPLAGARSPSAEAELPLSSAEPPLPADLPSWGAEWPSSSEPPSPSVGPPGPEPEPEPPLLEVEVRLERPEPSLRQRVEEALRGKAARLARLGVTLTGSGKALGELEARPLADLTPEDVLRAKWRRAHQGEPGEGLLATFRELLELVHQESR